MTRFIIRRFLWLIPTLVIVTFLVYVAIRQGTDPVKAWQRVNIRATKKQVAAYRDANGLYEGFNGYFKGYAKWLKGFVTGDWQRSLKGKLEVWPLLKNAIANSVVLGGTATIIGILVGNLLGIFAALKPGGLRDTAVNTGALIGVSVQPFITALLLILVFANYWKILPVAGIYPPGHKGFDLVLRMKHMILPVIVVSIQIMATYSRFMRSSLLEVMNSEYLRTARSKGISPKRVLFRHGVRNALIPVTTLALLDLGAIFGGLIITEGLFEYPGMGRFFLNAYTDGDFAKLMPWMIVIVSTVIAFNLLADVMYAKLDPRIRLV